MPNITVQCSLFINTGSFRDHNEDSLLAGGIVLSSISEASPRSIGIPSLPALFCVADGIGGAVHGEIASRMVLEYVNTQHMATGEDEIRSLLYGAKERLNQLSEQDPRLEGFGTTIAGLSLFQDRYVAFNCGDSRVYLIRNGELTRLTHDHSMVQQMYDLDLITDEQMRTHPRKNIITSSLSGDHSDHEPDLFISQHAITGPARFLLCTDGVWEALPDTKLKELCMLPDVRDSADKILTECLKAGAYDNITGIVVQIL